MPNQATLAKLHDDLAKQGRLRYACGFYRHIYQSARIYVRFLEDISAVPPVAKNDSGDASPLFAEFRDWM